MYCLFVTCQDAEADGWSQGSGATEDQLLYPLPRAEPGTESAPSPEGFTFSSQLRNLAVKVKLGECVNHHRLTG